VSVRPSTKKKKGAHQEALQERVMDWFLLALNEKRKKGGGGENPSRSPFKG